MRVMSSQKKKFETLIELASPPTQREPAKHAGVRLAAF